MELKKALSASLQIMDMYSLVRVCILFGLVYGNHPRQSSGIGLRGEPGLSLDPIVVPTSLASSSASSSASSKAGTASSMAFSSAGGASSSSRSFSGHSRSPLRIGLLEKIARAIGNRAHGPVIVRRRPLPLRRRRPKLLVYLRPSRQPGRTSQRTKALPIRQQRRPALPLNDVTVVQPAYHRQSPQVPLDEVLGLLRILVNEISRSPALPSLNDLVSPQRALPSGPPGVSFLGGLQGGRQTLPVVQPVPEPIYHHKPGFGDLGLAGINQFPSSVATASTSGTSASSSTFIDPNAAAASSSANLLTIEGQTPSGDLIIGGPGGTITIGAEVLNGISQTGNGTLIHTEFEEMEPEEGRRRKNRRKGLQVAAKNSRRPIFLHGKQTVVPGRGTISLGGGVQIAGQGNAPLVIDSGSTLTLNNNGGSGLKVAASGSASGEINIASASASGSVSKSKGQNGVSVKSGSQGKVIHLKGKDTIKVGGGKNSKIEIGNKASGIKAPANATFIVGG